MIGVDENDNKTEHEDASHDNEDTCEVCLCDVENAVHFTENNVEVQELFEDDLTNKAQYKDTTQDKVDDFNEDTCNHYKYPH